MTYSIEKVSPRVLTVVFPETVTLSVHEQVMKVTAIFQGRFPGLIEDTVPSYHQVTLFFTKPVEGDGLTRWVRDAIEDGLNDSGEGHEVREISVPVCYGGDYGPDLEALARYHERPEEEIIRLHTEAVYTVYMLGFLPGFPYLGGLDPALSTPRKTTPRQRVPAGSVGIAGGQTGVYPSASPGGWQLIGRTPINLVDVTMEEPCLFRPGDRIRFEAVSEERFLRMSEGR